MRESGIIGFSRVLVSTLNNRSKLSGCCCIIVNISEPDWWADCIVVRNRGCCYVVVYSACGFSSLVTLHTYSFRAQIFYRNGGGEFHGSVVTESTSIRVCMADFAFNSRSNRSCTINWTISYKILESWSAMALCAGRWNFSIFIPMAERFCTWIRMPRCFP